MIKPIMRDPIFLSRPSTPASLADLATAVDLVDTLVANQAHCVGMAANMIGVSKRIIVFADGDHYTLMMNPKIIRQTDPYQTEEGCLSLSGVRETKRYKTIKVEYQNEEFKTRLKTYTDWTAQIIQHEIDHCNGILI